MSQIQEMAIVMACVALTGVAANELMGSSDGVAEVAAVEVPEPVELEEVPLVDEPSEKEASGPLRVEFVTSGSLAGPSEVFARLEVAPRDRAVQGVELVLEPAAGVAIEDILDERGKIEGRSATIALGDLAMPTTVVLKLRADDASGELQPTIRYRDPASGTTSIDHAGSWSVSGVSQKAEVLVDVRRAYTEHALTEGRSLMEAGDYSDALELVRSAQAANVETGMSMRVAGKLRVEQRDLESLEGEIREAMKPRKKVRRVEKKPTIEIMNLN